MNQVSLDFLGRSGLEVCRMLFLFLLRLLVDKYEELYEPGEVGSQNFFPRVIDVCSGEAYDTTLTFWC